MNAYLGIKFHEDHKNRGRIERISAILDNCGFRTHCIIRDIEQWGRITFTPQELMQKTFEVIDDAQVVVIELTEKGVGVGIEAGYAYARGIPIITIAQHGSDISTTLRGISKEILLYKNFNELECYLKHNLHVFLENLES